MTIAISTLRDKAITIRLTRSQYQPYKFDRAVTDATEASAGVSGAGRYTKRLLKDCKELDAVTHAFTDVYRFVMEQTLPWMDEGVRVLPNVSYAEFCKEFGNLKTKALNRVHDLVTAWDDAIDKDKTRLGSMFNICDYPTKEELVTKFDIRLTFAPVPSSEDFRIDLSDDDKADLESAVADVESKATDYLLKQILAPVKAMADKLAVPIGQQGSVFRDTLVSNVHDITKRAKKLNINNDETINELIELIEDELGGVTANELRVHSDVRSATAESMRSVATKINQYFM